MSSIAKIADEAGVSVATVSLVANNKGNISSITRRRVKDLLDQHQFQPRSKRRNKQGGVAQAKTNHLGTICVVCPRLSSDGDGPAGVFSYWARSLQKVVLGRQCNFSCLMGELQAKNNLNYLHGLEDGLFQGVVLVGVEDNDGYVEAALRSRVPMVVLNRTPEHGEFSSVGPDNFNGGRLAAEHLVGLGHRRIGMIAPQSASAISHYTEARRAGFLFGLESHGLKPACMLDYKHNQPQGSMDVMVRKAIEAKVSGVFLSTDVQAVAFVDQCEAVGLSVPDDLAVVGFDHADMTTASGLRLTTIAHDSSMVAARSIEMLEKMMRGQGDSATSELVPVTLVAGETTGTYRS